MNAKYRLSALVGGILVLGFISYKVFVPLAYKAAESDLFIKETDDPGSMEAVAATPYTEMAFKQCNDYIKEELGSERSATFSNAPVNAWALGDHQYLINADVTISDNINPSKTQRYACRIEYDKGTDDTLSDKNNWSILGISGIEEL